MWLRFESTGRPPQSHYPTYRELLLATDALGERSNYLASEESFQFIKTLQQRDLVIPVVGDLSGPRALAAIGTLLRQRGQRLSAFYASNVEFYLFGDARFDRFVSNLGSLPARRQRRDHQIGVRPIRQDRRRQLDRTCSRSTTSSTASPRAGSATTASSSTVGRGTDLEP